MKHSIWNAFSALIIAAVILTGCTLSTDDDLRTLDEVQVDSTPFPDVDVSVRDSGDGTITADVDHDFDITDYRAKLTSKPAPSPDPESPSPDPESSTDASTDITPDQQQSDQGNAETSDGQSDSTQQSNSGESQQSNNGSSQDSGTSNSSTRGTNGVYNLSSAREYLARHCPGVGLESVQGSTSYYDPNRGVIMLGTNMRGGESRLYFVLMHELMHHYQWQYYSADQWNAKLSDGSLEREADQMTFHVAPSTINQGYYTNSPASGSQLSQVQQIVSQGRAAGC